MADNTTITPGTGLTVATDDVSSVHYPRVKRSVGADGSATDFLDKASRSDTYSGTGTGTTVDVSLQGFSRFAIQCKQTGTVNSWTIVLETSLDGTNFSTLLTHTKASNLDGGVVWFTVMAPSLYFRSRCTAMDLGSGTNVVTTIVGLP